MRCSEKEDLQQRCTAAYEIFEVAAEQLKAAGIWVDLRSKTLTYRPTPIKDCATQFSAFSTARWEHLKSSSALSKHLSKHRC